MKNKYLLFSLFLFCISCYKNNLYVQHEKMDLSYLASSHVNTPDYRKKHPPQGQTLNIGYDFPLSVFRENLHMIITVRFWDNKEDVLVYPIERRRGYKTYKFQDDTSDKSKRILTYKIDVYNEDGKLVDQWKHQFYKKLIEINKDQDKVIEEKIPQIEMF